MIRSSLRWPGIFALGLIMVLGAGMASAQAVSTGTITGSTLLPDGTASPGVTVALQGDALVSGTWSSVSDANGRFVFLRVPRGTYKMTASLPGFNTAQFEDIEITAGSTVPVTINLEIAAATGEIVVTSELPLVNTRSSTIDTTFNQEMLEALPTSRDSFYDLTLTAPGMSSVGSDESWLPSASAYGSASNENIFLVNGVNTTNPRGASWGSLVKVNYDTVEEVQVLSLGSRAEYGSFSGAAIDVMTKSGSNQFQGTAGYYGMVGNASDNMNTDFGADWLWAGADDPIVTTPIDDWEATITLGGPIVKDVLWFYGGFSRRDSETDTPVRPLNVYGESDLWDLKLTGQFGTSQRAWLGFHYEDNLNGNETWGPWAETMYYDQPSENMTLQFDYQWVITDRDLFGFKYLGFDTEQNPSSPGLVGNPGFINWWKWIGGLSVGVAGDFPYIEAQKSDRSTFQADYTHYADQWAGQHELKFGVQYTTAEGNWMGGYFQNYANFAYPYGWGYSRDYMNNAWWSCDYTWCVAPNDTVAFYNRKTIRNGWLNVREANSLGAFIDDQWVISDRVTVNIGVRYDRMEANYGQGAVYEFFDEPSDVDNPTVLRNTQGYDVYDFKTWSPRLGIAWTLTGDGKTVLRSHIGRYYAPLGVEALRRLGPDMGTYLDETWIYWVPFEDMDLNGNDNIEPNEVHYGTSLLGNMDPAYLRSSDTQDASWRLNVADGTTSPYTDQFNISIQRQLSNDIAIEASYIYKQTKDFLVLTPYDAATNTAFEWESRPYTTWTGYDTEIWSIVVEDFNGDGVIDGSDASYPCTTCSDTSWVAENLDTWNGRDVDRTYQGFQVVLTKRYGNRWQGNFAINYTKTDGFYPRPVDQNWYIDGPLQMDTPFGSTQNHFQNNMSGSALMTPKWMAKLAGSYTIPVIETDFGFRLRYDSGREIFPIDSNIGPFYQSWMGAYDPNSVLVSTGWHNMMVADTDSDTMPSTTIVDLNLRKRFAFGSRIGFTVSLDGLNVFNEGSPNRVGYTGGDYGQVTSLTLPRRFRLGLKLDF